jgi:hypothetical protein
LRKKELEDFSIFRRSCERDFGGCQGAQKPEITKRTSGNGTKPMDGARAGSLGVLNLAQRPQGAKPGSPMSRFTERTQLEEGQGGLEENGSSNWVYFFKLTAPVLS